jgi:hypothetical protein
MKTTMQSLGLRDEPPAAQLPSGRPEAPAGRRSANRLLLALVLVLAAALVGLGAWTILDRGDGESDAEALWDETLAAWSSYDRDAVESLYAQDAQLRTIGGGTRGVATFSGSEAIGASVAFFELEGLELARSSDVAVHGELAASFGTSTTAPEIPPETVLNVVQIRDGKIVRQWSFWPFGAGAPFDNALGDG